MYPWIPPIVMKFKFCSWPGTLKVSDVVNIQDIHEALEGTPSYIRSHIDLEGSGWFVVICALQS